MCDQRRVEQEGVVVTENAGASELRESFEDRTWRRTQRCDVAEADDPIHARPADALEDGAEGDDVPVEVGDEGDPHRRPPSSTKSAPSNRRRCGAERLRHARGHCVPMASGEAGSSGYRPVRLLLMFRCQG